MEKDGAGFKGKIKLTGLKSGEIDLSKLLWTYQVSTNICGHRLIKKTQLIIDIRFLV